MRIRVTVSVDVDDQAWADEYGMDRRDVRDDVRRYITKAIDSQLSDLGLGQVYYD